MKKIFTLCVLMALVCVKGWGQTVLISPTGDGGFESGSTFSANNWTVVNSASGTAPSKWFLSSTAVTQGNYTFPLSGNRIAYVSNNSGTGWTYNTTSPTSSSSHIYKDVTFPSGATTFLSFKYNAYGETNWDQLYVYLCPQTLTPIANSPSSNTSTVSWTGTGTATLLYTHTLLITAGQGAFVTIPITTTQAGNASASSNMRLVFTWKNDGTGGSEPPAAIDNIFLGTTVPLSGTYTIDNTLPTSGSNFGSFTAAIQSLNANGVGTNGVTFNVAAGQTFNENTPIITATGTSNNKIIFQKSGSGSNPKITPTGSNSTADYGIAISGGDYITFDGVDITATSGLVEYGYYLQNASTTNGAQNNTIQNSAITLNRTNTNISYGIIQNATAYVPSASGNANSGNKYYNLTIKNSYYGIYLLGNTSGSYPDLNCEIGTTAATTFNTIGDPSTSNDIGNGSSAAYGIRATYQSSVKMFNNEVSNIGTTSANVGGIFLENSYGASSVYNNKVHDIKTTGNSVSYVLYGIRADVISGNTANIYNNTVYNFSHAYTTATTTQLIRALAVNVSTTGTVGVYYNSVNVALTNASPSSSAAYFPAGTVTSKDNIFSNTSTGGATSKRYAIYWAGTTFTSDYNDLYVSAGTNNLIGYYSGTDKTLFTDWQGSATSLDANSKNINPPFSSDLHIPAGTTTQIESGGIIISNPSITTDIDADLRFGASGYSGSGTAPDLGADEFAGIAATATITLGSNIIIAGNITGGTSNNTIYSFSITSANANATLTGLSITTSGTYISTDITNLKVWYSSSPTFSSSSATLLSTSTTPGTAGSKSFTFTTNATVTAGATGYIFITADLPCAVIAGNTISVNAVTSSNTTFSSGTVSGTPSAGNTQTIVAATPVNATSPAASSAASSSVITWTYPTGCADEVMVVTAAGAANTGTPSGTTYTASSTYNSGTALGNGYVVYRGTGSTVTVTGLTNGTTYYFKIFTRYGNTWSSGIEVSATPALQYCASTGTSSASSYYITSFSTTGGTTNISNPSSGYSSNGYGNFTATQNITQVQTGSVSFSTTFNSVYLGVGFSIYVDWNQNGDFTDDAGPAYTTAGYYSTSTTLTGSLTVPATALAGTTRMRIVVDYNAQTPASCNSAITGETEDYTFKVTQLPNCVAPTTQPTALNFTNTVYSTVNGSFTGNSATNYLVIRSTGTVPTQPQNGTLYSSSNISNLGTGLTYIANSTTASFSDAAATGNSTYTYYIYSYNNTTCANGPAYSTATPLSGTITTIPAAPTASAATSITASSFTANWSVPTGGATGYYLDVSTSSTFASSVTTTQIASGTATFSNITGLLANTPYYYRVRAYNNSGSGANSSTISVTLVCSGPLTQPNSLILGSPTYTTTSGSFTGNNAGGYLVIRSTGTIPSQPVDGTTYTSSNVSSLGSGLTVVQSTGTTTTFNDASLSGNTTYTYYVYSFNTTNCTGGPAYSTAAPLSNSILTIPAPPTIANGTTPTGTSFVANWVYSTGGAAAYYLDVSTDPNFGSFVPGYNNLNVGNVNTYTVTGLSGSTTYYYRVRAGNTTGYSLYSASTSIATACPTFAATLTVDGTTTTPGSVYPTITAAINALATCGIAQPTTILLSNTYNPVTAGETYPVVLKAIPNPNNYLITIQPAANVSSTIAFTSATANTFDINGGKYYVIDGRAGGTGTPRISIANTNTAGPAVRFINDATNNTLRYLTVQSVNASVASATSGTILFGTGTSDGNDNNIIEYSDINGQGSALYGISSTGSSASIDNSGNIVRNNNIYDQFVTSANSDGIFLGAGSSAWTITNNKFYQTVSRTASSSSVQEGAIFVNNTSGINFNITNNIIGYKDALGTGTTSFSNTANFTGIYLNIGTATASSVQGNIIAGINVTSNVATAATVFNGIQVVAGAVNIGTSAANTIGAASGTGSITVASTGVTGNAIYGINATSTGTVLIQNNIVAAITATGSASYGYYFYGIATAGTAGNFTVSSNVVGSSTTDAINIGSTTATATAVSSYVTGLYIVNTGAQTITGNTVNNISLYSGSSTSNTSAVNGIIATGGSALSLTLNTVSNLKNTAYNIATSYTSLTNSNALNGILTTSSASSQTISQNTIYNLSCTNTGAYAVVMTGLYQNGTGSGSVSRNKVYGLSNAATGGAFIAGIDIFNGATWGVNNNMVSIINGANTNSLRIYGIYNLSSSVAASYFYNSVYIAGSASASTYSTSSFFRVSSSSTVTLTNNLFENIRGGTLDFAEYSTSATAYTSNNNALKTADSTKVGYNGSTTYGLTAWKTYISATNDVYPLDAIGFADVANGDLHLSNNSCGSAALDGKAASGTGILIDYDGASRTSPSDIGADDFTLAANFVAPTASISAPSSSTCSNTAITLTETGTGNSSWLWSSNANSATTKSVSLSPTVATTYSVVATNTSGCKATASYTVGVNAVPSGITASAGYTVCQNGSIPAGQGLTANASSNITSFNGSLASGGATYTRGIESTTGYTASSTATSVYYQTNTFTVSVTGSYILSQCPTGFDGFGTLYSTSFNPSSPATNFLISNDDGNTSTCSNGSKITYNLTAGNTYILVTSSFSNAETGSYTWTFSGLGNVTTVPAGTVIWYTSLTGGTSIGSGSPFNPVGVTNSGVANTSVAGTYPFYAAVNNGTCESARTQVNLLINDAPVATIAGGSSQSICSGDSKVLDGSASTAGGTNTTITAYQWNFSSNGSTYTTISGATANKYTASTAGYYTLTVANSNGCTTTSDAVQLTVNARPAQPALTSTAGSLNCTGTSIDYTTDAGKFDYAWTFSGTLNTDYTVAYNNGSANTSNKATITWKTSGSKTVTVNYANAGGGCIASTVGTIGTTVSPNATLTLASGSGAANQTVCNGSAITDIKYTWGSATGVSFAPGTTGLGNSTDNGTNTITIGGIPVGSGTYSVTPVGGCNNTNASITGTISFYAANNASFGSTTPSTTCYGIQAQIPINGTAKSTVVYQVDGSGSYQATIGADGTGNITTSSTLGSSSATTNHTITLVSVTDDVHSCTTTISGSATVTVYATPTVALASGSQNPSVCANNSFTSTFTLGGSATGATVSGLPSGVTYTATSTAVTISGTPTASGSYTIITTGSGGNCSASLAGTITLQSYLTWTGAVDTVWNKAGNWCSGTVPASTADVVIPTGLTTYPALPANITVKSITIESGAKVNNNGFTLTATTVSGSGTITGSVTSNLVLNGSSTLHFTPGANVLRNLTINGGTVTLGDALNITGGTNYGIVTVASGANLATGGNLTLKSDANGTAAIAANLSGSTYITGNVTIERFIPLTTQGGNRSGRAWRLVTAPVSGATINGAWQEGQLTDTNKPLTGTAGYGTLITGYTQGSSTNAFNNGYDYWDAIASGNSSIRSYDAASDKWVSIASIKGKLISSEPAYMLYVRGDRSVQSPPAAGTTTLRATGAVNQIQAQTTVGTASTYTLTGNPFPSAIDWYEIYKDNPALVDDKFMVWNSRLSTYGAYTLVQGDENGTYTAIPQNMSGNSATNTDYRFIPSSAGFYVYRKSASGGTLSILEKHKNAAGVAPASPFRLSPDTDRKLWVNVNLKDSDTSATLADGFMARFDASYSDQLNSDDAVKLSNFNENLSIVKGDSSLIMATHPDIKKTDTLQMKLWNVTRRGYQFQVKAENFASAPGIQAWLEDSYLKSKQSLDLSGGITTVNFEVSADSGSWQTDRFRIVFENNTSVLPVSITKVAAQPKNGGAEVSWTVSNETGVKQYTIEKSTDGGRTFTTVSTQPARNNPQAAITSYAGFDSQPQTGENLYRIRIEGRDGTTSYSGVVKVTIGGTGTGIQITLYPNPVREGKANLSLSNLSEGTYLVSVFTGSGQTVYQRKVTVALANTTQTEVLLLGSNLAQGSYQIRVADSKGTILFTDKLIVGR